MKLQETISLMQSSDYKERFIAEYLQLKIRYDGLKKMVDNWISGELDVKPVSHNSIYNLQLRAMRDYMNLLECRAEDEEIDLSDYVSWKG